MGKDQIAVSMEEEATTKIDRTEEELRIDPVVTVFVELLGPVVSRIVVPIKMLDRIARNPGLVHDPEIGQRVTNQIRNVTRVGNPDILLVTAGPVVPTEPGRGIDNQSVEIAHHQEIRIAHGIEKSRKVETGTKEIEIKGKNQNQSHHKTLRKNVSTVTCLGTGLAVV